MSDSKKLSSYGSLKNYLKSNIDNTVDWDKEDIKDYSVLQKAYASGNLSGDKLAEGQILLKNYLSDADALSTKQEAEAQAENAARQANGYNNYLYTRLQSYLPEFQGNSGMKGYAGLTEGKSIALLNSQQNAAQKIRDERSTTLASALKDYQGALASNSATAVDQLASLGAARDEKRDKNIADYISQAEEYIYEKSQDGKLSDADSQRLKDYLDNSIADDKVRSEVQKYIDFKYGSAKEDSQQPNDSQSGNEENAKFGYKWDTNIFSLGKKAAICFDDGTEDQVFLKLYATKKIRDSLGEGDKKGDIKKASDNSYYVWDGSSWIMLSNVDQGHLITADGTYNKYGSNNTTETGDNSTIKLDIPGAASLGGVGMETDLTLPDGQRKHVRVGGVAAHAIREELGRGNALGEVRIASDGKYYGWDGNELWFELRNA